MSVSDMEAQTGRVSQNTSNERTEGTSTMNSPNASLPSSLRGVAAEIKQLRSEIHRDKERLARQIARARQSSSRACSPRTKGTRTAETASPASLSKPQRVEEQWIGVSQAKGSHQIPSDDVKVLSVRQWALPRSRSVPSDPRQPEGFSRTNIDGHMPLYVHGAIVTSPSGQADGTGATREDIDDDKIFMGSSHGLGQDHYNEFGNRNETERERAAHRQLTHDRVRRLSAVPFLKRSPSNVNEVITFNHLQALTHTRDLPRLFQNFDVNCDGTVSKDEFVQCLDHVGLYIPKDRLDTLMRSLDPHDTGEVSYIKWVRDVKPQVTAASFPSSGKAYPELTASLIRETEETANEDVHDGLLPQLRDLQDARHGDLALPIGYIPHHPFHLGPTDIVDNMLAQEDPTPWVHYSKSAPEPRVVPMRTVHLSEDGKRAMRLLYHKVRHNHRQFLHSCRVVDSDRDGVVSRRQLQDVLARLGVKLTFQQRQRLLDDIDPQGNGRIVYRDIADLLQDTQSHSKRHHHSNPDSQTKDRHINAESHSNEQNVKDELGHTRQITSPDESVREKQSGEEHFAEAQQQTTAPSAESPVSGNGQSSHIARKEAPSPRVKYNNTPVRALHLKTPPPLPRALRSALSDGGSVNSETTSTSSQMRSASARRRGRSESVDVSAMPAAGRKSRATTPSGRRRRQSIDALTREAGAGPRSTPTSPQQSGNDQRIEQRHSSTDPTNAKPTPPWLAAPAIQYSRREWNPRKAAHLKSHWSLG